MNTKTAEFIIMEWFTEYRKANNLTNIQYVDVNDLLFFLARNHASQFKHPVPAIGEDMAMYETRLALNMLLRCFKSVEKTEEQQKYFDNAKVILAKHFQLSDILRDVPSSKHPVPDEAGEVYTRDELKRALEAQVEECSNHTQRCARDKGQASLEMKEWIESTPLADYVFKDLLSLHPSQPEGDK